MKRFFFVWLTILLLCVGFTSAEENLSETNEKLETEYVPEEITFELNEADNPVQDLESTPIEVDLMLAEPSENDQQLEDNTEAALIIGDNSFTQNELNDGDIVYDSWYWDHNAHQLVLCGGIENDIAADFPLSIYVMGGSTNFVNSISLAQGGEILGSGHITVAEPVTSVGSITLRDCQLRGIISAAGSITVTNVYGYGSFYTLGGDIAIKNSTILDGKIVIADGDVNIDGSFVEASDAHQESGVMATGKVVVKNSLILCKSLYGDNGYKVDKNTAVFVYTGSSGFTLWKSATLKKSFNLPESYSYTIPKNTKLTISKGCTLSHLGSLTKIGKISGTVINRDYYPGDVVITGSNEMVVGSSQILTLKFKSGEHITYINWKSSDPKLVSIDRSGRVTVNRAASNAIGKTVTITGTANEVATGQSTFNITIAPGTESIALESHGKYVESLELWLDPARKQEGLELSVVPANAPKNVRWKTDNSKIARVNEDGTVTAVKAGTTFIWAEATDGTGVISQKVKVKVLKAPSSVKVNKSISLSYDPISKEGTSANMNVRLSSGSASTLTFGGYDKNVVQVDENGTVTAIGPGKTEITVRTYNKKKATCKVTIENPYEPKGIKLAKTAKVNMGDTLQLIPELTPSTAIDTLKWSSDKTSVATVVDGLVTPHKKGTAKITVKTSNGKKATCKITVENPYEPKGITLDQKGTITMKVGDKLQINATLTPSTARDTVTWSSSKKSVATVKEGLVTAVKKGSATITVKTSNGKKAKVKIKVTK